MTAVLVTAPGLAGHVHPLVAVGEHLMREGYAVTVLTGAAFAPRVTAAGLRFRALPEDAAPVGAARHAGRARRVLDAGQAVVDMLVAPLAAQHRALEAALADDAYDLVLSDTAYLGALPLVLTVPRERRLPVLGVSATPLSVVSEDCAPFGPGFRPGTTRVARMRDRQTHWLLQHGPLRVLNEAFDAELGRFGVAPGSVNYLDAVCCFDRTFHLAPPELEYPRRELPPTVELVGPVATGPVTAAGVPAWWPDLRSGLPVVHVTQGTVDNRDPRKLLLPVVEALADEPVLTVVTTGGRPVDEVRERARGGLPPNARVAELLPYDRLLPLTSVMVSNGGFGGVQQALRHGVPLVVAGDTEDKPEVAARVAHVGAGIDLRTGTPGPHRVRRAVRRVLDDPRYRGRAAWMSGVIAERGDARRTIARAVGAEVGDAVRAGRSGG